MAALKAARSLIFLVCINRIYADPVCTQKQSATGLNVACTAGTNRNLRRGLVSDDNRTTEVLLKNCRITKIEEDALNALPSLEHLDMSHNNIAVLMALFEQTPNMKKLNLSYNEIEEIKPKALHPMTRLSSLDLSNNIILGRNLDAKTFERCRLVEYLDLSGNPLIDTLESLLESLQNIKTLKLNRCSLHEVPSFALRSNLNTMTRLTLSSNQITRLHDPNTFIHLVNVEHLDLDGNLINFLHEDVFKPLKSLKTISLQYNKIARLPETLFTNCRKLGNINLSHNLIEYVPVNAFRYTALKNLNVAVNRFTYLQDNFCLELRNAGVRVRKFFFNQNPWQCSCLNDILKEMKKFGIEYNGAKYNGRQHVCVTSKEFQCKRHMSFNDEFVKSYNDLSRK